MHIDVAEEPLCARIYRQNAGAHDRDPDFAQGLHSRNALGQFTVSQDHTKAILRQNLEDKCLATIGFGTTFVTFKTSKLKGKRSKLACKIFDVIVII